jgi:Amidohydrolase family
MLSFLAARQGRSRINFGASVPHALVRALAIGADGKPEGVLHEELNTAMRDPEPLEGMWQLVDFSLSQSADSTTRRRVTKIIEQELTHGALGIGMPHGYYPSATHAEILELFQFAGDRGVPIFTHACDRGLAAVQEVVANAAATGAPLYVVHLHSAAQADTETALALIAGARARGTGVSTEVYPCTAASTTISAGFFGRPDWRQQMGINYADLQWQDTGEWLTAESFTRYCKLGGTVIMHSIKDAWLEPALKSDWVMIVSDAMPYARGAHPRSAGTISRVPGHYVREKALMDLPVALRKMTLLPAQRLESSASGMKRKGRVQPGADADLVAFNPATIIDTATYTSGPSFSEGMQWVFVGETAVVAPGKPVEGVFPGEAIVSDGCSQPPVAQ